MKQLPLIVALACVLSSSALAGEVPTVGVPAPMPIGTYATASPGEIASVPGDIPSVGAADKLSSDALSALLAALSFLAV